MENSAATITAAELAADTLAGLPPPVPPAESPAQPAPLAPNTTAVNPPANSPAPAAPAPAPVNNSPTAAGVDRDGVAFDPAVHLPEKDKNRRWKKKSPPRRGRPPGSSSSDAGGNPDYLPSPENPPENPPPAESYVAPDPEMPVPPPAPPGPDKFDLAADLYCRSFYALADGVFQGNGEWAPDDAAEHESLRNAAAAYMRMKGMDDLPPGPALLLAIGTFGAKRIQRPNTSTRFRQFVAWIRAKFASWRSARKIERLPEP